MFAADIALKGHDNDLDVKGEYTTGDGQLKMQLDLGQLNLAAFSRVDQAAIESMKGRLKGKLAISGNPGTTTHKRQSSF